MPDLLTSDPLAALIPLIAAFGVMTPMIATFLERFVPVLPSYAVLVVIGVAAADGSFSLPAALALRLVGSTLGCLSLYFLGRAVGERRSRRVATGGEIGGAVATRRSTTATAGIAAGRRC